MESCASADVTGQDGSYADTPRARHFAGPAALGSDYTTEDKVAGLIWRACTQGQEYDGSACAGTVAGFSWEDGIDACEELNSANGETGYAGINSWRLPALHELITLVDYGKTDPTIDSEYFPDTYSSWYWTSDTHRNIDNAFSINFDSGNVLWWRKLDIALVRCVADSPTTTDSTSGLIWTKCSMKTVSSNPEMDTSGGCTDTHGRGAWADALAACENLDFAGKTDWRLPNVTELHSLVDLTQTGGVFINEKDFPNMPGSQENPPYYWSSTTYNGLPQSPCTTTANCAWYVNFNDGYVEGVKLRSQKDQENFVRCVSGPELAAPDDAALRSSAENTCDADVSFED
ncbi:MAG: DUF1566 domain-containing protein [Deltaproteobacteria bacterium]|nr:DUF1566 domain-containing protein [Deltaproteobacteria bacterium]